MFNKLFVDKDAKQCQSITLLLTIVSFSTSLYIWDASAPPFIRKTAGVLIGPL